MYKKIVPLFLTLNISLSILSACSYLEDASNKDPKITVMEDKKEEARLLKVTKIQKIDKVAYVSFWPSDEVVVYHKRMEREGESPRVGIFSYNTKSRIEKPLLVDEKDSYMVDKITEDKNNFSFYYGNNLKMDSLGTFNLLTGRVTLLKFDKVIWIDNEHLAFLTNDSVNILNALGEITHTYKLPNGKDFALVNQSNKLFFTKVTPEDGTKYLEGNLDGSEIKERKIIDYNSLNSSKENRKKSIAVKGKNTMVLLDENKKEISVIGSFNQERRPIKLMPDGKSLILESTPDNSLYVMDINSKITTPLLIDNYSGLVDVAASPDGNNLVALYDPALPKGFKVERAEELSTKSYIKILSIGK